MCSYSKRKRKQKRNENSAFKAHPVPSICVMDTQFVSNQTWFKSVSMHFILCEGIKHPQTTVSPGGPGHHPPLSAPQDDYTSKELFGNY